MAIAKATTTAPAANPAAPKPKAAAVVAAAPTPISTLSAPAGVMFVSLRPSTFSVGLLDDVDVTITDALACAWDFQGHRVDVGQGECGPALLVEYTDASGAEHHQFYSAGKIEDWQPHESGEGFVAVSGKTAFNNSTNVSLLLASMVKCGFPEEAMSGNVRVIVGLKCHVRQVDPERKGKGMSIIRAGQAKDKVNTVLLVSHIHELPAGIEAGPGVATGAVTGAVAGAIPGPNAPVIHQTHQKVNGAVATVATAASAPAVDLDSEIQGYLMAALMETPVIEKKAIAKTVFQAAAAAGKVMSERNALMGRSGQQDFLQGLAAIGISYTGTEISLAG